MQRIANCLVVKQNKGLLLQKPRRNWWVAPGGKIENEEQIQVAVKREYLEETGLEINNPHLKCVSNIVIKDQEEVVKEWFMFTFLATEFEGENWESCPEGILEWKELDEILSLPMNEGDRYIFENMLLKSGMTYATFVYDLEENLLEHFITNSTEINLGGEQHASS